MLYSLGFAWSCNSIRDKFEAPIKNVSGEVDLLMVSVILFVQIEIFIGEASYCMLERAYLLIFYA